jgi:hypothetical protein
MAGFVVLDKSFVQSVSAARIAELHAERRLVMTDALFYELLTTDPTVRARCFAKFPSVENPVMLVGHLGPMLVDELETLAPMRAFEMYALTERFVFNGALLSPEYVLPADAAANTAEEAQRVEEAIESYVKRTNGALTIFPNVVRGSDSARLEALEEYEAALADPREVVAFYRSIGDPRLPPADLISEGWATFRFIQVHLFFALHTLHRHRGPIPEERSRKESVRLEHDIHDASLFQVASVAGGLATCETKLQRWWRLLFPQIPLLSG